MASSPTTLDELPVKEDEMPGAAAISGAKPEKNTNKRRRLDLSSSLDLSTSNLNPLAEDFTPSASVTRQESARNQGTRPKTSRPPVKRLKSGRRH